MHTQCWWGNLRGRDLLEDRGVDGRIILRWIYRKWDGGAWTDLALDSSCLASQEGLCSMEYEVVWYYILKWTFVSAFHIFSELKHNQNY